MITAHYLCHGHWTVIPHQLEANFEDMRNCGFDGVAFSFSESEMMYARRTFELQIGLAKKVGLKCHVIPSRLGGRFAGAPWLASMWLAMNDDAAEPNNTFWPLGCVSNEKFCQWIREFLSTLIGDYDLDGVIWDEPKGVDFISHHPDTIRKYGGSPTVTQMMNAMIEFLQMCTTHVKSIRPELAVTLFTQKQLPEYFTSNAAKIKGLDYFGYDGNLARESFYHEKPEWRKYRIDSVWERTVTEAADAGTKTYALIENFLMPREAIEEYEQLLDNFLANYHPDHLALYYYGLNNEDPERVHAITRRLMQKHLK